MTNPEYTRRVPAEWDGLMQQSQTALDHFSDGEEITRRASQAVLEQLEDLDNDTLELNRYYAIGLTTCALMQAAAIPENRQRIIENTANTFYLHDHPGRGLFGAWSHPGIRHGALTTDKIDTAARFLVDDVDASFSAVFRLLGNGLLTARNYRLAQLNEEGHEAKLIKQSFIGNNNEATQYVADNMLGGSVSIHDIALEIIKNRVSHIDDKEDDYTHNPLISSLATGEQLSKLVPLATAIQTAGLHLGEFSLERVATEPFEEPAMLKLYTFDSEGRLQFERANLPNQLNSTVIMKYGGKFTLLHTTRLKCPAINVPGAILAATEIARDSIALAQAKAALPIESRLSTRRASRKLRRG